MLVFMLVVTSVLSVCGSQQGQYGPDPWHSAPATAPDPDLLVPPDLRRSHAQRDSNNVPPVGDWFFKRLLVIILKNGVVKTNEDGSKEISIEMKLPPSHWSILDEYVQSEKPLTVEMYRRIVGYLADAIYKPSFSEKVEQAWSEYVMVYYNWYRVEITWITTAAAIVASAAVVSKYMSRKVFITVMLILLYVYEGFISFKEMEKHDYEMYKSAVSRCNWYFWLSSCDMPMPDPLVFLKHMHPGRIGIRLLALFVTEPMLLITSTVGKVSSEITSGLWSPLNIIANGILVVTLSTFCIMLIIMFLFNFLLNIPFNIGFFAGLINFGVSGRRGSVFGTYPSNQSAVQAPNDTDRLTGDNLQKLLHLALGHKKRHQVEGLNVYKINKKIKHRNNQRSQTLARALSVGPPSDVAAGSENIS